MPKRPVKAQASSTRAFGASPGNPLTPSAFVSKSSPLAYFWEPPDLSFISDPNLVVSFKNLSKKDSTTKAKALEELQAYITSHENVEESILETWIAFYPRASIENSRRVRQLAHAVQGRISVNCGKRVAKYMPQVIGAWLAGTYDTDRAVVRAAQDALHQLFSSPEKLQGVRKAYQVPLLEFCQNVIDNETPQTLSDERTASPDDVEAKYNRVMASVILLLTSLLRNLSKEVIESQQSIYSGLIEDEKLWKLAYHGDPQVRRAVHRLLPVLISRHPDLATPARSEFSKAYIGHGLRSDQTSTSLDFVQSLSALLRFDTEAWRTQNPVNKGLSRLCSFLKRGSQTGPMEFWPGTIAMLRQIPRETIISTLDDAKELLKAMFAGVTRKDEPRSNLAAAWRAYVELAGMAADALTYDNSSSLITAQILPIVQQYLQPQEEHAGWTLPDQVASSVIDRILDNNLMRSVVSGSWTDTTKNFVEVMQTSLPEQSKDYRKSQDAIAKQGSHWAYIAAAMRKDTDGDGDTSVKNTTFISLVMDSAIELLVNRRGKPYGVAATIESCVYSLEIPADSNSRLISFTQQQLPKIFVSPSAKHLAGILYFFYDDPWFKDTWELTVQNVLSAEGGLGTALPALFTSSHMPRDFDLDATSPALQAFVTSRTQQALERSGDWSFLKSISKDSSSFARSSNLIDTVLSRLMSGLSTEETTSEALNGLETLSSTDRKAVEHYMRSSEAAHFLPRLLYLTESSSETDAQIANKLNGLVQSGLVQTNGNGALNDTLRKTIRNGLVEPSSASVSTDVLVKLADDFVHRQKDPLPAESIADLLPPLEEWQKLMEPFLRLPPLPSFAITSSLRGLVHLVKSESTSRNDLLRLPRDADGYTSLLRILLYITPLLQKMPLSNFPAHVRPEIVQYFCLSVGLANNNLTVAGCNHLWSHYAPEVETEMSDLVGSMRNVIQGWASKDDTSDATTPTVVQDVVKKFLEESSGRSPTSFNSAEAYTTIIAELADEQNSRMRDTESLDRQATELYKNHDIIPLAALVTGHNSLLPPNKLAQRLCNELIADLTGLDLSIDSDSVLYKLALLNSLLRDMSKGPDFVAKQRIIFLMKNIVRWLSSDSTEDVKSEAFTILVHLLPVVRDLYGDHWQQILKAIADCWLNAPNLDPGLPETHTSLSTIHSSLKLYAALRAITQQAGESEDPNDDLVEALADSQKSLATGLFRILSTSQDCPDEFNQPLRIINDTIFRNIRNFGPDLYPESDQLYPSLFTPSAVVQLTVYEALRQKISAAQEQVSLDAALENKKVRLPDELLSLIIEAPTTSELSQATWDREIPLPLRGYLLSWLLVFYHFVGSSYRVKNDYLESLKELGSLPSLLDFIFDFMGHARGKPPDASKFSIVSYDPPEASDDPKKDCIHLVAHIYYLALQHAPGLVKSWWIDLRARALVTTVESWTEKYVSPHIISAALKTVTRWAAEQSDPSNPNTSADEERLKVTVSERANEVRASYDIDEQTMSILIRLPGAWPLRQAEVHGVSRVGIDEKKWQSWVRGCQGVITFSNNNLIDGLLAFRRNVVGAMKGQTECAICYSIISADKQLPSKKCSTCKNLFHSGCLYRWFKTSNASTCPLCRNPFNYG